MSQAIEKMRRELGCQEFDQGVHWRILFIGRSVNGTTDIVSCLSRSLRNLGHHVLDYDLKKHRNAVENPNNVTGGHGPIFIKIRALQETIDNFRPQMIVCGAGGLTFKPEDADRLKAQGIVLVGLTLSDPDVFPSVHAHAHVFDFHTTNAHMALEMYREKGIFNTLYFPFGIDRGFVTQQTTSAPELAADVICMGHATGRPERNALMTAMASRFDVKTYGRGWELPGSEPVAGERMVQAMRMGKVHVNFPLTRAGYINIKCGVFESVGSGALLCTGRFPEMATFFDYGDEILGYTDEEDLTEQLRGLLASPERYREVTERAFRRLISEHLYEHRWMALFETIFNTSPATTPWLDESRIAAIRTTLSKSYPRAKKVVISGFYGASNLGDELILASIRQGLERADESVQVWVAAENPSNVERDHGLQAFSRKHHHDALQSVRTATAVVLGGGGLWHDYTFERSGGLMGLFSGTTISIAGFGILPMLGKAFDAPFHVVGMGVGPLEHPDARRMVKLVASQAETIYVRDEPSAELLRAASIPEDKLYVAPDVVYGLELPPPVVPAEVDDLVAQGFTLIGLNLRPWAKMDEAAVIAAISGALLELAADRKIAVIGIPMQAGERVDVSILGKVAAACAPTIPMVVLPAPLSIQTLTGAVSRLSVLLSMRLHACLVGHRMRKPVVGIAYDPKVSSHFAELGRSSRALTVEAVRSDYVAALVNALAEGGKLPESVDRTLATYESEARKALAVAAQRIARLPTRSVVYEVPTEGDTTHRPAQLAPLAPPVHARGPAPSSAKSAVFTGWKAAAKNIPTPPWSRHTAHASTEVLQICMCTSRPLKHQGVSMSAEIALPSAEPMELALVVESPYERQTTLGRVFFEVQVGDHLFTEDLALTSKPLHLHYQTTGQSSVPISLRLHVVRDCAESSAWQRATRVALKLLRTMPLSEVDGPSMYANRGAVHNVGKGATEAGSATKLLTGT